MAIRWAAAIEHPFRARHALGHTFDLGCAGRQGGCAGVAAWLRDDDPDRHRYELGSDLVAIAFFVLDPAALAVDQIVKGRHRCVEALRDLLSDRLSEGWLREDDEVIATDMAREVSFRRVLFEHLEDDRGQRFDDVVAAYEAVMVVVTLESVDVGIEDGEAILREETVRDLTQDVGVAAHARQGI